MGLPGGEHTGVVYDGNTALTVKFASVSAAGTVEVVAAVSGKKIRLLGGLLGVSASCTLTWKSATTALSGATKHTTAYPIAMPLTPLGWVETAAGEALNLIVSGAGTADGHVTYIEV